MNTNKVFLVNDPTRGSRVVTKGVVVQDIKEAVAQNGLLKLRAKDIDAYAEELMNDFSGKAIDEITYKAEIAWAPEALREYTTLTPYKYAKQIRPIEETMICS